MAADMPKLFFYTSPIKRPRPIGGLTVIFQIVQLARELTDRAFVIAERDTPYYFDVSLDVQAFANTADVKDGDIVVFSETDLRPIAMMPPGIRRWILCQNHHYIFNQRATQPGWDDLAIEAVICSSRTILNFVKEVFPRIPSYHLPCFLDHAALEPTSKRTQIAYMPRKRRTEADFLIGALAALHPQYDDVRLVTIDGLKFTEAAAILRESSIFLALGHLEGLGLPALEAMSAGCLVVGFAGGGGREFASPVNGLWCSDDDVVGAVAQLARAVDLVTLKPLLAAEIIAQGRRTALRYDRAQTIKRLTRILSKAGVR